MSIELNEGTPRIPSSWMSVSAASSPARCMASLILSMLSDMVSEGERWYGSREMEGYSVGV